jgi:sugar lactone lactonase YvrE
MKRKSVYIALAVALLVDAFTGIPPSARPTVRLVEVAESLHLWTGLAVSKTGRVFVNYPRWSEDLLMSVGEWRKDGSVRAYPNTDINSWKSGEDPAKKFVCVQSVYIDDQDRLWVLDPANPMFRGIVDDGPKLVRIDLSRDTIARTYLFDEEIAPKESYLNDVRIDTRTETAFITDSGRGAIVVVDLKTGSARRRLEGHPSTRAEPIQVVIDGTPFPGVVHSDGIALDATGGWLYYQALTGRTLYRVPTESLRDETLGEPELVERVEAFAESGVSDGLLFDPKGIYLSSLEDGAIKRAGPGGRVETLIRDPRIVWPDSFARGPDGSIWFTTSQIHLGPKPATPYRILRLLPDSDISAGSDR